MEISAHNKIGEFVTPRHFRNGDILTSLSLVPALNLHWVTGRDVYVRSLILVVSTLLAVLLCKVEKNIVRVVICGVPLGIHLGTGVHKLRMK